MASDPEESVTWGLRERKKAQTRAEIRRQGLLLFARHGFAETSVDQIAAAADVSPSTVFRYFPTKDSIALSERFDPGLPGAIRRQPKGSNLIQAIKAAVGETYGLMADVDAEEDRGRQALIVSTPELALAAVALIRSVNDELLAAFRERSDEPDDYLRALAGAVVGVLLGADRHGQALDSAYVARVQQGLDHLATGFGRGRGRSSKSE